ncbi:Astacin-like metalloendopeptidase [Strongyloides ratti]|uniref:Metalloendopeptidase n=1 Tax=Strongyloides ratti TaxID=34506 RepID=A0A090MYG9_STRRB|nr:Astacin-like metalloendopeptidase [Strongyloides ratti]CEF67164.2 Astacin-like metalloendopeptidase [Strongyloides ratti]
MLNKFTLFHLAIFVYIGYGIKVIDIFNQKYGDIYELRTVFNDPSKSNIQRNALKPGSDKKWNILNQEKDHFVIPYTIKGKFNLTERKIVRRAMDAIEKNTCIVFKPRKKEKDYVQFDNQFNEGCYSLVGREGGPQTIMLESNIYQTCLAFEIVVHELLHTVGLWHEQMRFDRDRYIKIHYENIDKWMYPQFAKVDTDEATTYNIPYDYKSIMHYGKNSFARAPGLITMETLDKRYQDIIGTVKDVAKADYNKVCLIYNCEKCMNDKNWKSKLNNFENKQNDDEAITKSTTESTEIPKKVTSTMELSSTTSTQKQQTTTDYGCSDLFPNVCKSLLSDSDSPKTICKMFGPIMDSWCCKSCKMV